MLCIELLLKHIDSEQFLLIAVEVRILTNKSLIMFPTSEIISGSLAIFIKILGISGRPEYWQVILSQGIIEQLNLYLQLHILNNEIVTFALKIFMAFASAKTFTKIIAEKANVEGITKVFVAYFMEKTKCKAIIQIFSEILPFVYGNCVDLAVDVLLKVLKRNFESVVMIKIVFKGLLRFVKVREANETMVKDKAVEMYQELLMHLGNELVNCEEIIEYIYIIGVKSEKVQEYVWRSQEVQEVLKEILTKTQNSSTGSSSYNGNSTLHELISEILTPLNTNLT